MTMLFLSPHFDDVALSCGGYVRECAAAGESVTVVTVCAGAPGDAPLSPFALAQHRRWGNPRDPIAVRAAEDRRAVRLLGAHHVHLSIPDAIYRRKPNGMPLVHSNRSLFGRGYVLETALVDEVARQVRALAPRKRRATIVAPLGTGRHVDHLLTRDATLGLRALGYTVWWYEELPYAEKRNAVGWARRAIGPTRRRSRVAIPPICSRRRAHSISGLT